MTALNPLASGWPCLNFKVLVIRRIVRPRGTKHGRPGQHPNLQGLGGQGMNPTSMGNQEFPPQGLGLGSGLGRLIPNLQNMQTLQALQSLGNNVFYEGGLINPGALGGRQNEQIQNNPSLDNVIRGQKEDKRR